MKKQFEGVTAITCKDGITTVEFASEVKEKPESLPDLKPGAFCSVFNKDGECVAVFIFKESHENPNAFVDYCCLIEGGISISEGNSVFGIGWEDSIAPSTPSEQKMLEDALLKVGKVWNPDTQRIERWRATLDEPYKLIGSDGKTSSTTDMLLSYDNRRFDIGNYFHPSEDTSEYEKAYRDIFKDRLI